MKYLGNGKLTAEFDAECGATREILNRVGDKWTVLVDCGGRRCGAAARTPASMTAWRTS